MFNTVLLSPFPVSSSSTLVFSIYTLSWLSSNTPHKNPEFVFISSISESDIEIKSSPSPKSMSLISEFSTKTESEPCFVSSLSIFELYILISSSFFPVFMESISESYIVILLPLSPPFICAPFAPITTTSPVSLFSKIWTSWVSSKVTVTPDTDVYEYFPLLHKPKVLSSFAWISSQESSEFI